MKRRARQAFDFLPVAVAILIAMALLGGCASTPPDRIAYNSLDAITTAAQSAVSAFKDLKASGQIADPDGSKEARVRKAYSQFQATNALAIDLARDISQKQNALTIANTALNDLLPILWAFGVPHA